MQPSWANNFIISEDSLQTVFLPLQSYQSYCFFNPVTRLAVRYSLVVHVLVTAAIIIFLGGFFFLRP